MVSFFLLVSKLLDLYCQTIHKTICISNLAEKHKQNKNKTNTKQSQWLKNKNISTISQKPELEIVFFGM